MLHDSEWNSQKNNIEKVANMCSTDKLVRVLFVERKASCSKHIKHMHVYIA